MASWINKLVKDRGFIIISRARHLSRPFLGQPISFHHQGQFLKGIFSDIAPDGDLLLGLEGAEKKYFIEANWIDPE